MSERWVFQLLAISVDSVQAGHDWLFLQLVSISIDLLLVDWLLLVCISIFLDALRDLFNLLSLCSSVLSIAFSPTIHVSGGV